MENPEKYLQECIRFNLDSLKKVWHVRLGVADRFLFNEAMLKELRSYKGPLDEQPIAEIAAAGKRDLFQKLRPELAKTYFKNQYQFPFRN